MRYISRIYLHWSDRFLGASPPLAEINLGRVLLGKFLTPVEHQAVDLMPIVLKKIWRVRSGQGWRSGLFRINEATVRTTRYRLNKRRLIKRKYFYRLPLSGKTSILSWKLAKRSHQSR